MSNDIYNKPKLGVKVYNDDKRNYHFHPEKEQITFDEFIGMNSNFSVGMKKTNRNIKLPIPSDFISMYNNCDSPSVNYFVKHYSVSPSVIHRWLKESGVSIEKSNERKENIINFDEFIKDVRCGLFSYKEISDKYSLNKRSVCNIIDRNNIESNIRKDGFNPSISEFRKVLLDTRSNVKTAEYFGVTLATVLGFKKRNDIDVGKYFGRIRSDINIDDLKTDCEKDVSIYYLAQKYSASTSVLRRISSDNGFDIPESIFERWDKEKNSVHSNIDNYVQLNKNGLSLKDISIQENISLEHLKSAFKKNGVDVVLHSYNKSKGELEVKEFIESLGFDCHSTKKLHNGKRFEIDCFVPDLNFGVEYCGEYWHSFNAGTPKNYHKEKQQWCEDQGITLITIFEHEWLCKREILESMIKNRLGISKRIYARKTKVKVIDSYDAKKFHAENHINGYVNSSLNYGLFFDNDLLMVLSLARSRFDKKYSHEITRLSTKKGYAVVGGFSKLLNIAEFDTLVTRSST